MAGNKEYNSDLQIKGKINLKDVPNNTPTGYLVWNSQIKDIAQRSPAQTIADLNLITATNIASLYYNKTQVDANIKTAVDAIQIGGRNLLKNSKTLNPAGSGFDNDGTSSQVITNDNVTFTTNSANGYIYKFTVQAIYNDLDDSDKILSVEVFVPESSTATYISLKEGENQTIPSKDKWFKLSTLKFDQGILLFRILGPAGSVAKFRNFKLEKGNKATDWTPAPEDQVSDWNTTDPNDLSVIKNLPDHIRNIGSSDVNNWNNKVNAVENAIAVGFSNGNANDAPYIQHSTGVLRFLATQTWVNSQGYFNRDNFGIASNWKSPESKAVVERLVIGELAWRNYGNNHTIFDASSGLAPNGVEIDNINSIIPWENTFPTLMGWNGGRTYGVRVDSSRTSDFIGSIPADNVVTTNTDQVITGLKNFTTGFNSNNYNFRTIESSNVISIAKDSFNNNTSLSGVNQFALAMGDHIFPSMNLQPYDPVTESWNNKGYIGLGFDIFPQFRGDTNYRPSHNAHDSWIAVGRALGIGFVDGTNIQLFGTTNMHKNDVKYADSVTVIGKGNTNGIPAKGGITLDPNRVVTSVNGSRLRDLMADVIIVGHENWSEDIHQSVIVGSNTRPVGYIFNSLILGHGNSDYNAVFDPTAPKINLDSDVIIGMGNWKKIPRHEISHNLLIGMDYAYTTGGAPNPLYRSLIEGVFRGNDGARLKVNGTLISGHEKLNDDIPNAERIVWGSSFVKINNPVVNISTDELTFNGSDRVTNNLIYSFPADSEASYFIRIESISTQNVGTWGYTLDDIVDSGNVQSWIMERAFTPTTAKELRFTSEGNFIAVIKITITKTMLNGVASKANLKLLDSTERTTLEVRTGIAAMNLLALGRNSGKYLNTGSDTILIGNDIFSHAALSKKSILIGHNVSRVSTSINDDIMIGHHIMSNALLGSGGSTFIGNNIAENATTRLVRNISIGGVSFKNFKEGNDNVNIGYQAADTVESTTGSVHIGYASGRYKSGNTNIFIGGFAGGYDITENTFNNIIVIGYQANPEGGDNTITIGNGAVTDNYFRGTIHAGSFKVRGGTNNDVMLADGNTIPKSSLVGTTYASGTLAEINAGTNATRVWTPIILRDSFVTIGTTQTITGEKRFSINPVKSDEGFQNTVYKVDQRNRIWSFGNADYAGITYYQGNAIPDVGDAIGFHFLNPNAPDMYVSYGGRIHTVNDGTSLNWNTAFNWGNHATQNYATTTFVNTNFIPKSHPVYNVTQASINNWNNKINAAENAVTVGFSNGNANDAPYIQHSTAGLRFLATQTWVNSQGYLTAANTSLTYSGTTLNLTVAGVTKWVNIDAIQVGDGIGRNPNNIIATDNPKRVRFDFVDSVNIGTAGNYAGVMSFSPWDGSAASTGDSAYQLAFCNETGVNGAGLPGLKLRKGIDSTWGSWYTVLTEGNGVTLNTAQTITGVKKFDNSITAPSFLESSLRSLKTNIETFEKSGIDLINELGIVTFDRKDKSAVNKIGIIADDSPKEFLSESKSEVDLYKTIFIQAKAIQELTARLEELEKRLI